MAKLLWLLRHGDAVAHDACDDDADRELTPRGQEQSRAAGLALALLGVELDACYASPKVRARDTARLAGTELDVQVTEDAAIAGGFARSDAETLLSAHDGSILVVGHEPDFSALVHDFTGARVDFKKGGIAAIKVGPAPELVALLRPAELRAMAG